MRSWAVRTGCSWSRQAAPPSSCPRERRRSGGSDGQRGRGARNPPAPLPLSSPAPPLPCCSAPLLLCPSAAFPPRRLSYTTPGLARLKTAPAGAGAALRARAPELEKLSEVSRTFRHLARDRAMNRDPVTGDVFQDVRVGCRFAPGVVLWLQAVD